MSTFPPTIPASTESTVIVSEKLVSDIIIAETITDGIASLSGGYLSNLTDAINSQDVARKSQVFAASNPGGIAGDVQYNDNSGFEGSNNFNFTAGTLTVKGPIEDQTGMTFNKSGIISNVTDPVGDDELATKSFVDALSATTNITNVTSDSNVSWTAESMFGVIIRNTSTPTGTTVDEITNGGSGYSDGSASAVGDNSGAVLDTTITTLGGVVVNVVIISVLSGEPESETFSIIGGDGLAEFTVINIGLLAISQLTDTTASAAALVANYPGTPTVGASFRFLLINENIRRLYDGTNNSDEDDLFQCNFVGGTGVTIEPNESFIVPRTYTLDAYIIFDNVSGGSEAVTIHINSIDWFPKSFYFKPKGLSVSIGDPLEYNIGPTQITTGVFHRAFGQVWNNIDISSTDTGSNVTYLDEVAKGLSLRAPAAASSDTISNDIATKFSTSNDFTIVNTGTGDITLNPQDTLSTYVPSSITVQAGNTASMGIVISEFSDFIEISELGSGYSVGPATTTGGSGTGFEINITSLFTAGLVINNGTSYTVGTRPLENLFVGGSGSGLTFDIGEVNGSGKIQTPFNIYDADTLTGDGYLPGDVLTVGGSPGSGGQVVLLIKSVINFTITNYGSGYEELDILTVQQAGSGNDCEIQIIDKLFTVTAYAHMPN